MNIKKISALFFAVALTAALMLPASAVETTTSVIDLGDGYYVVETLSYGPSTRSGDTVNGTKNATLYQGSTVIGTTTLLAYFDISGSSAKATRAVISGIGKNGWTYDHGTTSLSGNKATGTATYRSGSTTKSHTLTITCSSNGTLS